MMIEFGLTVVTTLCATMRGVPVLAISIVLTMRLVSVILWVIVLVHGHRAAMPEFSVTTRVTWLRCPLKMMMPVLLVVVSRVEPLLVVLVLSIMIPLCLADGRLFSSPFPLLVGRRSRRALTRIVTCLVTTDTGVSSGRLLPLSLIALKVTLASLTVSRCSASLGLGVRRRQ